MKRVLPLVTVCLVSMGCQSVPPDVRIARENAELREQQAQLVDHMQRLQHEIENHKATEEWLREALNKATGRPF